MNDNDMALEVFLASAATYAPELPQNLLMRVYESKKNINLKKAPTVGPLCAKWKN